MPKRNPATVAQSLSQNQVIESENNPPYYKDMINKLLYYIITTRGEVAPKKMESIFYDIRKTGLLSPATISIYYYLMINRAATRQKIAEELETAEPTVYKNIRVLVKQGFIKKAGKIKAPLYGGHKPTIYAVIDASPEDIAQAKLLELQRRMPGFQLIERITQWMLEEWIPTSSNPKEVTMNQLSRNTARFFDTATYNKKAIYDMVAHNLQRKGVKVWR